jgi:TatA/E family protein of Tat protein translocase
MTGLAKTSKTHLGYTTAGGNQACRFWDICRRNEWLIVLLIVLVLFGASRLPALARSIGEALTEFRRAARAEDEAEQAQK